MHAIARLVLHPHIRNIQTSWVKMGPRGAQACLAAGASDLGGTLMNESITRAAGAAFGQELPPRHMRELIEEIGRVPASARSTAKRRPSAWPHRCAPRPGRGGHRPPRRHERSKERPLVRFG